MRVIGIDPGLRNMGWGIIDVDGSRLAHVANGTCKSDGEADLAERHGIEFIRRSAELPDLGTVGKSQAIYRAVG